MTLIRLYDLPKPHLSQGNYEMFAGTCIIKYMHATKYIERLYLT